MDPFVIGIYHAYSKPSNVDEFLQEFVTEMQRLEKEGVLINGHKHAVNVSSIVCDMPARSFIKCVKGHGGYGGCDRCTQNGVYVNKVTYPECNAPKRTDDSFKQMTDRKHHLQTSPLSKLSIGMVTCFPIDCMHLVCLGVVQKLISLWLTGPLKTRLGRHAIRELSEKLSTMKEHIPCEFKRKPRPVSEFERWKAVEFRQLLLYTGPVCLLDILPSELYQNFLLLSVAMNVFLNPFLCHTYSDYAHSLLILFVEHFAKIYGKDTVTYNVHGLVHLSDDAKKYGVLDNVSAFPFENFLGNLKKLVRKPSSPLQQIVRRLSEIRNDQLLSAETVPCGKGVHHKGPVLIGIHAVNQFREIEVHSFSVKLTSADRYVQLRNGDIVAVHNIVVNDKNTPGLIYARCKEPDSFFPILRIQRILGLLSLLKLEGS